MLKITNNTRATMDFIVKGEAKDGVPPTESVGPGETKSLNVDPDTAQIRGREHAGAITVERPRAAPAKPKE